MPGTDLELQRREMKRFGPAAAVVTAVIVIVIALAAPAFAQTVRGAARVDFDDQLIQGQVNRGAVHLIERKDSDLGSLVKVRKSYRSEILAGSEVENVAPVRMAQAQALAPVLPLIKATETAVVVAPVAAQPRVSLISLPKAADVKKAPAKKAKPSSKTTTKLGGSRVISRR